MMNKQLVSIFFAAASAVLVPSVQAADLPSVKFDHEDWQLVCDNTRTCRAAGYSIDGDEQAVSVLLTRKAGANQPVVGEVVLGQYEESRAIHQLPSTFKLTMLLNNQSVGTVVMKKDDLHATLSAQQLKGLIAHLKRNGKIEWVVGKSHWQLSGKGAAAVLLKMDEFQGRLGTQGALVKKGSKPESAVLPALPVGVVNVPTLAKPQAEDTKFLALYEPQLRESLFKSLKNNDDCPSVTEEKKSAEPLTVSRLSDTNMLVSTQCWSGAYNVGTGYWLIKSTPPFDPVLVTTSGTDYADGIISSQQKGRGLGDCWSTDAWAWNGKDFIQSEASTTGFCRLIAAGGSWALPEIQMQVHQPAAMVR